MKTTESAVNHYFGPALEDARKARGLSIRDVAKTAPCSIAHLYAIERQESDLTVGMASRLCVAVGITLSRLARESKRLRDLASSGRAGA